MLLARAKLSDDERSFDGVRNGEAHKSREVPRDVLRFIKGVMNGRFFASLFRSHLIDCACVELVRPLRDDLRAVYA